VTGGKGKKRKEPPPVCARYYKAHNTVKQIEEWRK